MENNNPGALKRFWLFLRKPSAKYSLLTLLLVGGFGGIIFWGGFNTALEMTNRLQFCIGCHEMRDNVYKEYKTTIHYQNRVGVRAICSDCHVPREWGPKVIRKMKASFEVWAKITGRVDTKEKFEANRMRLAQIEWARMKGNGSKECQNCHSFESMKVAQQKPRAQKMHQYAQEKGWSCIYCHKGIAHLLPEEYDEDTDPDMAWDK